VKQDQPTEGQLSPFSKLADQKDQFEVPYLPISDFGRGEWAEIARCSWLLQERNLAGLRCARNPPVWLLYRRGERISCWEGQGHVFCCWY
jgi:hypothetical protein